MSRKDDTTTEQPAADGNPLRQRTARDRGLRGVCIICGNPIDKHDNYALIYGSGDLSETEGPAHEECLTAWQHAPKKPDKE